MINAITKTNVPRVSLKDVGSRLHSILAMDILRKKVDLAGRTLAEGAIQVFTYISDEQDENPIGISGIPYFNPTQFTSADALITTAGMCSQIFFYGIFYASVCAAIGPIDTWSSPAVLLGPWWSSSYWMDWLLYDFFRSAVNLEDFNLKPLDNFLNRWLPHNHHETLREAFKYKKICLALCALAVCTTYLCVCSQRPPATQLMMNRSLKVFNSMRDVE